MLTEPLRALDINRMIFEEARPHHKILWRTIVPEIYIYIYIYRYICIYIDLYTGIYI